MRKRESELPQLSVVLLDFETKSKRAFRNLYYSEHLLYKEISFSSHKAFPHQPITRAIDEANCHRKVFGYESVQKYHKNISICGK